jgi:hypothetical protein
MTPHRVMQQRSAGWRKPANCRCVGRPGPFGNPFHETAFGRAHAVALHKQWLAGDGIGADILARAGLTAETLAARRLVVLRRLPELRGLDLACWCPFFVTPKANTHTSSWPPQVPA